MTIETLSEKICFGGVQGFYQHESVACDGPMRFGVYRPPQCEGKTCPMLFFLAGLTCTEETFAIKAGAQRLAAELGLMLITPDTSPRDTAIEGATGDWEFGEGAGFYLDATAAPWSDRFRMETYVVDELPALIVEHFGGDPARCSVFGHSMGGHGALVLALRHPQYYRSVSALAPICAPTQVPWGHKALPAYLGDDSDAWAQHDACALLEHGTFPGSMLVDQGLDDQFLKRQLRPEMLERACRDSGQALELRRHEGYDHSYYFIASFVADHLRHHARAL